MASTSPSSPSDNLRQAASVPGTRQAGDRFMNKVFAVVQRIAFPYLRVSLGVVLFWIGALKYFHPAPIVGLLQASFLFRFLATNGFVYVLGTLEIVAAVLLAGQHRCALCGAAGGAALCRHPAHLSDRTRGDVRHGGLPQSLACRAIPAEGPGAGRSGTGVVRP